MIRVVLVDDQAIVRAGVARILGPDDGFEVVAECSDGDEAVEAIERTGPDIVLMDIRMPRVDGLEATRRLGALEQPPPVLVLTTFDEDEVLWGAIQAGASTRAFVIAVCGRSNRLSMPRPEKRTSRGVGGTPGS